MAPLAHLALPLIGQGQVELDGRIGPAAEALATVGLEPLVLEPKEGLALLNGTQLMTAIGALVLAAADRLVRTASVAAAISTEALRGTDVAFSAAYQSTRPHPGQVRTAAELRWLLRDSELQRSHHADAHRVQDPYSIRCVPQVHGAVRDALDHLRGVLDIEMNSATDNPLVFPEGGEVPPTPWPRAAGSSSAAATSTASPSRWPSTSPSSPSRSWATSASGASPFCWTRASTTACLPSWAPRRGSTLA